MPTRRLIQIKRIFLLYTLFILKFIDVKNTLPKPQSGLRPPATIEGIGREMPRHRRGDNTATSCRSAHHTALETDTSAFQNSDATRGESNHSMLRNCVRLRSRRVLHMQRRSAAGREDANSEKCSG